MSAHRTRPCARRARLRRAAILPLAAALLLLLCAAAHAGPLDDAKRAGHAGEQLDGYLGLLPGAPPEALALVGRINAARSAHYAEIAANHDLSPATVAALAGAQLVARAEAGAWIRDDRGEWQRR